MLAVYSLYVAVLLLPAALAAAYYLVLLLARLCGARAIAPASDRAAHSFAILIPAHDEESVIADVLRSCASLDYPKDRYEVFVIADNCQDRTAEVVRSLGATCLERNDRENVGKGFALQWAFQQVLPLKFDAVVVLDADCCIDAHALRVFDQCLEHGVQALQANYVMSNPDASPISYVACVGNLIEYELFYAPKSSCGLAVMLVGTGMVFRRDLLESVPWAAHSLVEDAEYTLALARHGVRVRFVSNVHVCQPAAERSDQLEIQRTRWARGSMQLTKASAVRFLLEGIGRRQWLLADAGWTLLVVSRPLVLLHLLLCLAAGVALALIQPTAASMVLLASAAAVALMHLVYFGAGVGIVGLSMRRVWFLLTAPLIVARLSLISLAALWRRQSIPWVRTPR
jgi:1,2-diacylglycerol 3-beta-glucosyltransferase